MGGQEKQYKLLFSGPVGAGKTTAISSISDISPIETDVNASDEVKQKKQTTTVALDYGVLKLDDETKIHLYGTPGQVRFKFMWEILSEGSLGLVLLFDNIAAEPLHELRMFVAAYKDFITPTNLVVGITKMDVERSVSRMDYHAELRKMGLNPPVFEVDARDKKDISFLVQTLLYTLDPRTK